MLNDKKKYIRMLGYSETLYVLGSICLLISFCLEQDVEVLMFGFGSLALGYLIGKVKLILVKQWRIS